MRNNLPLSFRLLCWPPITSLWSLLNAMGGISRRRVIFTFDRVVAEADKDPLLGDKIAAELPVVIRYLLAQFTEPEHARHLLLEQRNSDDALIIKRATDPVIDLCGMVLFLDEPKGLMMGG